MKKFEWPQYKEPQAHHWIIARLLRAHHKAGGRYNQDQAKATVWMMRELGGKRVVDMLEALRQEDSRS